MTARRRGLVEPSVLPGFGLALGFTLTYMSLIVLLPLAALVLNVGTEPKALLYSNLDLKEASSISQGRWHPSKTGFVSGSTRSGSTTICTVPGRPTGRRWR